MKPALTTSSNTLTPPPLFLAAEEAPEIPFAHVQPFPTVSTEDVRPPRQYTTLATEPEPRFA